MMGTIQRYSVSWRGIPAVQSVGRFHAQKAAAFSQIFSCFRLSDGFWRVAVVAFRGRFCMAFPPAWMACLGRLRCGCALDVVAPFNLRGFVMDATLRPSTSFVNRREAIGLAGYFREGEVQAGEVVPAAGFG